MVVEETWLENECKQLSQTFALATPWKLLQGHSKRPIKAEQECMSQGGAMAKRLTKNAFAFIKSYLIYEPLLATVELFSPRRDPQGRSPIPFAVSGQPSSLLLDPMQSARQLLNIKVTLTVMLKCNEAVGKQCQVFG